MKVLALKRGVGTGKTEAYISRVVKMIGEEGDPGAFVVLIPRHTLADELVGRFEAEIAAQGKHYTVGTWRSRGAKNDRGVPMCADYENVREAEKLLADIDAEICKNCQYRSECPYLDQAAHGARDIWIGAHDLAFLKAPAPLRPKDITNNHFEIQGVVIDESIIQTGLDGVGDPIEIVIDSIDTWELPEGEDGKRLAAMRAMLKEAARDEPDGWLRPAALWKAGLAPKEAYEAIDLEWSRKLTSKQVKNWRERTANATITSAETLWKVASEALHYHAYDSGRGRTGFRTFDKSGRIEIARNESGARILRLTDRKSVHKDWYAPTLIVDANLDITLLRNYWPGVSMVGKEFIVRAPFQNIVQVTGLGAGWAKGEICPPKKPGENASEETLSKYSDKAAKSERNRLRLRAIIMREHARVKSRRTLVVSYKAAIEAMSSPVPGVGFYREIAPGIDGAWFQNLAGIDRWKDADLIIVVGRPLPGPRDIERMAGALTGEAPISPDGPWYPTKTDSFRLILDTPTSVSKRSAVTLFHPDPTCERLRRLICEGEIEQAIGRGRGIWRKAHNPLQIVILGNEIMPFLINEEVDAEKFEPSPYDLQIALGSIAFENSASIVAAYPGLWPSADAARKAIIRHRQSVAENTWRYHAGQYLNDRPVTLECVEFKLAGARMRPQKAFHAPTLIADPKAAIECLLSAPVASFSFSGSHTFHPAKPLQE